MITGFSFVICLAFLLYFSYQDIKHWEVKNPPIFLLFCLGVAISIYKGNLLPTALITLLIGLLAYGMWHRKIIGGADLKILVCLPGFLGLIGLAENLIGLWFFLIIFLFVGTTYGLISKIIIKKKITAFVPAITLTYALFLLFRLVWLF